MASLWYHEKDEMKADGTENGQDPAKPMPAEVLEAH
jgi:hypothetical protein